MGVMMRYMVMIMLMGTMIMELVMVILRTVMVRTSRGREFGR